MKYSIKNEELRITDFGVRNGGVAHTENLRLFANGSLAPRGRRSIVRALTDGQGLCGDDTLAYVDNGKLYYGGMEISGLYLTSGEKTVLKVGNFIVIFPDEMYLNLENYANYGSLNGSYFTYGSHITVTDFNGNLLNYNVVTELPEDASEGAYCALQSASGELTMKRKYKNGWYDAESYIRIDAGGIGTPFRNGDTVYCTGLQNVVGSYFKIAKKTTNWLLIEGIMAMNGFSTGSVRLTRNVPSFDYVTVSGGRLFGVRRGADKNGALVCRMYGSCVGDPFNFAPEAGGLVMDIDINGMFTGICDYLGSPVAFTENEIIEARIKNGALIGTVIDGYGVENGACGSISQSDGVLYYKSRMGACRYDGSYPECISEGIRELEGSGKGSVGIVRDGEYHINITDSESKEAIFVYNIKKKTWCKDSGCGVKSFALCKGNIYAICSDGDIQALVLLDYDRANGEERLYLTDDDNPTPEVGVEWSLKTEEIGSGSFSSVCPVRVTLDMKKGEGSAVRVGIQYDGEESEQNTVLVTGAVDGAAEIPMPIRRCGRFALTVSGVGDAIIRGMLIEYRSGGVARAWK